MGTKVIQLTSTKAKDIGRNIIDTPITLEKKSAIILATSLTCLIASYN